MSTRAETLVLLESAASMRVPEPRAAFLRELELSLRDQPQAFADVVDLESARATGLGKLARPRALIAVAAVIVMIAGSVAWRSNLVPVGVRTVTPADKGNSDTGTGRGEDGDANVSTDNGPGVGSTSDTRGRGGRTTTSGKESSSSSQPGNRSGDDDAPAGERTDAGEDGASATTSPRAASKKLTLDGYGTPARIYLNWSRYDGDDFAAYLVLRSIAPDDPNYPTDGQRTLMMRRYERLDDRSHDDTPKVGSTTRWMIVVVDKDGRELARSNVVEPTERPAETPAGNPVVRVVPGPPA